MSGMIPFDFEGAAVRVVTRDAEPWFVLADVCKVLEIADVGTGARRLDDDEKGLHTMQTPGGAQSVTVINESGLYALVLTSRKPAAKRFRKWVTAEVLPAIRMTGGFIAAAPEDTPEAAGCHLIVRAVDGSLNLMDAGASQPPASIRPRALVSRSSRSLPAAAARVRSVRPSPKAASS